MTDEGQTSPIFWGKAKGRGSRGASVLTVRIYELVADAGEAGMTAAEIHRELRRELGFVTDTLEWFHELAPSSRKNYFLKYRLGNSFDAEHAGLVRVRLRINSMLSHQMLQSAGNAGRGQSRYLAGRPPQGYRPKYRRQSPHGYYPIDPKASKAAAREQVALIDWIRRAQVELAKDRNQVAKLRPLVAEALEFLQARSPS